MKILELDGVTVMPMTKLKMSGIPIPKSYSIILILNEEDLLNNELACKIKGWSFNLILIPETIKDIFESDTHLRPILFGQLSREGKIEYF